MSREIQFKNIFKAASVTYYYTSIFFPSEVRQDVFTLYAFVRTADDFVDKTPQDVAGFEAFCTLTQLALEGQKVNNPVIAAFCELAKRKKIKKEWIESFLWAMKQDITKNTYETYEELERYMYGSAEVIGLMMSVILDLPAKSFEYACLQGKAMQLINFVRDIQEDLDLNRVYLPQKDLKRFSLTNIIKGSNEVQFSKLIRFEFERYFEIQKKAEEGYKYIPRRYRIPIQTAAEIYLWTAKSILKNPYVVFEKKVKPGKYRVFLTVIKNFLLI